MAPKKTRGVTKPPAEEPRPWDKLLAAQKAFEEAEREYGHSHDWMSAQQKYTTLDRIDETMESSSTTCGTPLVQTSCPPPPDLTSTANLLLTELRGRLMRRLKLEGADREMRQRLGLDR